jgi:phage baseplate assembly protein gpV
MLDLAKVVGVHRESGTVDLVMLSNDRPVPGVKVMSGTASGNTGFTDIPVPDVNNPADPYKSSNTGGRDMVAVVGTFSGIPVVLGFLFPTIAQCLFPDANRMIYRHASDVYLTIDDAGNTELAHPSGAYLRIGKSGAHEDLTGKDYNGKWKIARNTAADVHFHLAMGGGAASLDIAPDGTIVINANGTVTINAQGATTVKAPSVTVDSPQSTFTGAVTVQGAFVFQSGMTGSAGSGGGSTMTINGTANFTGDVTAQGTSVHGHKHTAQGANAVTSPPN